MQRFNKSLKLVAIILALNMLMISGPVQSVMAAMVGTDTMIDETRGQEARNRIKELLAREDIRQALINQGIDPPGGRGQSRQPIRCRGYGSQ